MVIDGEGFYQFGSRMRLDILLLRCQSLNDGRIATIKAACATHTLITGGDFPLYALSSKGSLGHHTYGQRVQGLRRSISINLALIQAVHGFHTSLMVSTVKERRSKKGLLIIDKTWGGKPLGFCFYFSFSLLLEMRWCFVQRQGFANRRAMGLKVRARETTTVLWYAGMKVSQVANAEDSVTAASALSFVDPTYSLIS